MSNPFFMSASEELGRADGELRISQIEHHDRAAQALATLAVAYEKQTENLIKLLETPELSKDMYDKINKLIFERLGLD